MKPKMALIRGVRPPEGLFYDAFQEIETRFLLITQRPTVYPVETENLRFIPLKLRPKWGVDPISLFNGGNYTHRSWIEVANLAREIKEVEVVNISGVFFPWCAQAALIAKRFHKKVVTVIWELFPHHPGNFFPPYRWFAKTVVANTDLFIVRSRAALNFTDSLRIPRRKVRVIYKGVDLEMFCPPKKKTEKDKVTILYVGQLEACKGVGELLEAFGRLRGAGVRADLIIAGKGKMEEKVVSFGKQFPIHWRGFVSYSDLPAVYRQADIFCSPSKTLRIAGIPVWEELFSYTLMEAQASGLPIVATRSGGIPEEVGGNNILAVPGDVDSLQASLKKLIAQPNLRVSLGKSNRKRAEHLFDLRRQARKTEKAILSIL